MLINSVSAMNINCQFRLFSTSLAALSVRKEARVMNKILNSSSKKRSWYPSNEISASSLPGVFHSQKGERNNRRVSILNKLFMKYVSDIMSTGEISNEVAGLRLEISKVKISPDFGTLNVYWVTKGTCVDKEIENILSQNAGKLKHELTQLRVIGNVPTILFVKDRSLSQLAEVDALLSKADFGEDFEPTDPSLNVMSEFTLSTKLPQELQDRILEMDGSSFIEEPLPPMATNVLGLEHDVILHKILRSMNKSQALHRNMPLTQNIDPCKEDADCNSDTEKTKIQSSSKGGEAGVSLQNSDIKKFVARRMTLQRKISKMSKNYQPEKDLLSDENISKCEYEDNDEYMMSDDNFHRFKELEIDVDELEEIIDDRDYQFYRKDNL